MSPAVGPIVPQVTSWVWKAVKLIAAVCCGAVVVFGPSEVDQLAIGQALPRIGAIALLALISIASAAALAPTFRVKTCGLKIAGYGLIGYGITAGLLKHLVALPTAGLAVIVGLLFLDRAAAIAEQRTRLHDK